MSLSPNSIDLCTVAEVNDWIGEGSDTIDNDIIQRTITNLSRKATDAVCHRRFLSNVHTITNIRYDGGGRDTLIVRDYPIISVSSLTINGSSIPQSTDYIREGFTIDQAGEQNTLRIISAGTNTMSPYNRWGWGDGNDSVPAQWENGARGLAFSRGIQNVGVTYDCGFYDEQDNESFAILSGTTSYTVTYATTFYQDLGVTGFTLTTGTPAEGEYAASNGVYTFNASDAGKTALISYTYGIIPYDLNEAMYVWVAENVSSRQWLGKKAQNIGLSGSTGTSYTRLSIPEQTADVLEHYTRRFPD
jgi:hypothetical protein